MNLILALTNNTAANGGQQGSGYGMSVALIISFAVMAVFMVITTKKQTKEQKQREALIATVEVGDSVLTSSGFYGVITDVTDDVVIVEFGNNKNCRIPMKKECILEVEKAE